MNEQQIEALKELGSEWQKYGKHRIYINGLGELYGIETTRYNSGNISSASLNGDKISNSLARKILGRLTYAKVWYDVAAGKFEGKEISQADFETVVAAIRARVDETMSEVAC